MVQESDMQDASDGNGITQLGSQAWTSRHQVKVAGEHVCRGPRAHQKTWWGTVLLGWHDMTSQQCLPEFWSNLRKIGLSLSTFHSHCQRNLNQSIGQHFLLCAFQKIFLDNGSRTSLSYPKGIGLTFHAGCVFTGLFDLWWFNMPLCSAFPRLVATASSLLPFFLLFQTKH